MNRQCLFRKSFSDVLFESMSSPQLSQYQVNFDAVTLAFVWARYQMFCLAFGYQ